MYKLLGSKYERSHTLMVFPVFLGFHRRNLSFGLYMYKILQQQSDQAPGFWKSKLQIGSGNSSVSALRAVSTITRNRARCPVDKVYLYIALSYILGIPYTRESARACARCAWFWTHFIYVRVAREVSPDFVLRINTSADNRYFVFKSFYLLGLDSLSLSRYGTWETRRILLEKNFTRACESDTLRTLE